MFAILSFFIYLKEDAVALLRKTTSFLETMNSRETKELEVGTEINLNILTGLGNVLAASSKDMDIDSEKENAHIDKNKVRRPFPIKIKGIPQYYHKVTFI